MASADMTGGIPPGLDRPRPNRAQRFIIVGVVATAVDYVVLLALLARRPNAYFYADLISVGLASVVSHLLHRLVTLANHPKRRWVEDYAASYFSSVFGSLAVDVVAFTVLMDAIPSNSLWNAAIAKTMSLALAVAVRLAAYRSMLSQAVRAEQHRPRGAHKRGDGPQISVVIPAFGEADRIGATIAEVRRQLAGHVTDLEIVVVDDGSTDDTAGAAERAGADTVVRLETNAGKGAAVRAGMLAATGSTRAFIDADLAYSPDQILGLLRRVEDGWDVVVGSRKHSSTTTLVRPGRLRELGSRAVNVMTSVALLGQYRDTQCGLKAFSADAAESIFSVARIDRFAMDIEALFLVERFGYSLDEVPVTVTNSDRSTVRIVRDTARLMRDVLRIRLLARDGAYGQRPAG